MSNDASSSCLDSPEVMNSKPKLETTSNLSALTCFLSGYFIPVMGIKVEQWSRGKEGTRVETEQPQELKVSGIWKDEAEQIEI